jgi:hypothetical protein
MHSDMLGKDRFQSYKNGALDIRKLLEDSCIYLLTFIVGLAYGKRMGPATKIGLYLHDWAGLGYKNGPRNTGIHVYVGHCPAHMNGSSIE